MIKNHNFERIQSIDAGNIAQAFVAVSSKKGSVFAVFGKLVFIEEETIAQIVSKELIAFDGNAPDFFPFYVLQIWCKRVETRECHEQAAK